MRSVDAVGTLTAVASVALAMQMDRVFSVILLPTYLFCLLLLMMSIEMFTAYRSALPSRGRRRRYNWDRVVSKKIIRIALVFACVILDATGYLVSRVMPQEWSIVRNGYPLTTISSIIWFIGIEGWKIGDNFTKTEGLAELPPAFRFVIGWIKKVDLFRGKNTGDERWYDHLDAMTDDQVIKMFEAAKKAKEGESNK